LSLRLSPLSNSSSIRATGGGVIEVEAEAEVEVVEVIDA
jgi:hypothetical protein